MRLMKRDDKNVTIIGCKKKNEARYQFQSSLNQQERSKIYKVEMKTCENMQTRKMTCLQTVDSFLSEVCVVMMKSNDGGTF